MLRSIILLAVFAVPLTAGCREPDRPVDPGDVGTVIVDSDPRGARILLNGEDTDEVTPDTLMELRAERDTIVVVMDTMGVTYGFRAPVRAASENEIVELRGPLLFGCPSRACVAQTAGYHEPNTVRFATSPVGALMVVGGAGNGLFWPATTANSYVSAANAVIAAVRESTGRRVALGPYDFGYLFGRPVPAVEVADDRFTFRQTAWVLPPSGSTTSTIRGLEVEQTIVGDGTQDGIVLLRLVFRNITATPLYRVFDPGVAPGGETYEQTYIGLTLDVDVGSGDGEANDDMLSYVPDRDMAFMYDSDFKTDEFDGDWQGRPGVVGLQVLEAPADTDVRLNGWPAEHNGASVDWAAGTTTESVGWSWLSATQSTLENHPDERVGYAPAESDDYRMSVSVGELRLAPGDSAALTIALLLAPPTDGTFTSGTVLDPGDPTDTGRPLYDVVADLLGRSDEAATLLPIAGQ